MDAGREERRVRVTVTDQRGEAGHPLPSDLQVGRAPSDTARRARAFSWQITMGTKRHGLATLLRSLKSWGWINEKYGSPIAAARARQEVPYWNPARPSEHIKRLCVRALRGKVGATFEDWNELVDRVIDRSFYGPGSHAIRRACAKPNDGLIVAWFIEHKGFDVAPMCAEGAAHYSNDPGGDRVEKEAAEARAKAAIAAAEEAERRAALDRWWRCDLCGESKRTNRRRAALYGWRAERNAQGGFKRGQPNHIHPGNFLCAECNAWVRKQIKQVERAQRALAELAAETKILNKAIKEINHGTQ